MSNPTFDRIQATIDATPVVLDSWKETHTGPGAPAAGDPADFAHEVAGAYLFPCAGQHPIFWPDFECNVVRGVAKPVDQQISGVADF